MRPRVFIVEPYDRVDVYPAENYGDIVYLFPIDGDRPSIWDKTFGQAVLTRLEALRFDPAKDYFLIVGHMATVCLALNAIAAGTAHQYNEHLRLLLWDARDQQYVLRQEEAFYAQ